MHVQVRTLSNNIVLRPVLELSPEDLGRTEAPSSKILSGLDWLSCLERAGISASGEVVPGSWLVYTDDIVDPTALRTVIRAHLGTAQGPGLLSPLSESALQGGFVLLDGSDVVLAPGCCGHLGHVKAWKRAVQHRGADPLRLYNGHPEVAVSYENGLLCLHERFDLEHQNKPKTLRVTPGALASAVDDASQRVADLMNRLRRYARPPRRDPPLNGMAA